MSEKVVSKPDLIRSVAESTGKTIKEVTEVVDCTFDAIYNNLAEGSAVQLTGYMKLSTVTTQDRFGRNPSTGATMLIKGSRRVKFSIGKILKEKLN